MPRARRAGLEVQVGRFGQAVDEFIFDMAERRDGNIVVMSSIASMRANPILGGYGAAKAALNGIVRSIAVEWGASNVRVNAIAPSVVRTSCSKDLWSGPEREKTMISKIPAKRIADADDIVGAAILLSFACGLLYIRPNPDLLRVLPQVRWPLIDGRPLIRMPLLPDCPA